MDRRNARLQAFISRRALKRILGSVLVAIRLGDRRCCYERRSLGFYLLDGRRGAVSSVARGLRGVCVVNVPV